MRSSHSSSLPAPTSTGEAPRVRSSGQESDPIRRSRHSFSAKRDSIGSERPIGLSHGYVSGGPPAGETAKTKSLAERASADPTLAPKRNQRLRSRRSRVLLRRRCSHQNAAPASGARGPEEKPQTVRRRQRRRPVVRECSCDDRSRRGAADPQTALLSLNCADFEMRCRGSRDDGHQWSGHVLHP